MPSRQRHLLLGHQLPGFPLSPGVLDMPFITAGWLLRGIPGSLAPTLGKEDVVASGNAVDLPAVFATTPVGVC